MRQIDQRIWDAAESFPATFGLRGFPGDTFRIGLESSYINDYDGVTLYTQRYNRELDQWQDFAKGSLAEIRAQMVEAP
jgi:hypothetical protein